MIALAIRLGAVPQTVLDMPHAHFMACLALMHLEQTERDDRRQS